MGGRTDDAGIALDIMADIREELARIRGLLQEEPLERLSVVELQGDETLIFKLTKPTPVEVVQAQLKRLEMIFPDYERRVIVLGEGIELQIFRQVRPVDKERHVELWKCPNCGNTVGGDLGHPERCPICEAPR